MALSPDIYSATLLSKLKAQSYNGHAFNGAMMPDFCKAVGVGVVTTTLTVKGVIGGPAGAGNASGVGITGFSASAIAALIQSTAKALFGSEGPCLYQFCKAVGDATVEHFALATLTSDANGTAKFPSFAGKISPMASAIQAAAPHFKGALWPAFTTAIATGICTIVGGSGKGSLSGASGPSPGGGSVVVS
ncbi:MAG: hypothetical protein EBZ49_00205 [Proteobacteria bacterium]|nr:hypothetical protein [Pseudomonadota bacterium]